MANYDYETNLMEDEYDDLDDFIVGSDNEAEEEEEELPEAEEEEEVEEVQEAKVQEEEPPVGVQEILSIREQLKAKYRKQHLSAGGAGTTSCSPSVQEPAKSRFGTFFGPSTPALAPRLIEAGSSSIMREIQNVPSRRDAAPSSSKSQPNASDDEQKPKIVIQVKRKVDTLRENRDYSNLFSDDGDTPPPPAKEQPETKPVVPPKTGSNMDNSDDDFERPSRSSPRLKSKKSSRKKQVEDIVSDSGSENRAAKKRKTCRKSSKDAKAKQNVGFKCSPHLLFDLVKNLDMDQRKWVDEIGFGIFLSMPNCRLPKDLTVWLVNQFSWKNKALIVRGRAIKIKPLIKKLLGIPDGPYAVPLPRSKRGKAKGSTDEEKELKEEKGARGLSYKSTLEALVATHDPVQFKRSFMLYVLCIYLAPSSGHFVNLSYSPIVSNVEIIKDMNWCDHVADVLIEGIREYRESKAANVNVHGCVHVLLLIYIDVVKSGILKVPHGDPRAIYVTTEMLDLLDLTDLKTRTPDGPVYGKLEMEDSTYTDDINHTNKTTASSHDGGVNNGSPGCSHSVPVIDVEKLWRNGIQQIEAHYLQARDVVYADCFKLLSQKITKIDSERSSAIVALHEKLTSLQTEAASMPESSIPMTAVQHSILPPLVRGSKVDPPAHDEQESQDPAVAATLPFCSTPYTNSEFLVSSSQSDLIDSSRVQFPVELSLQAESPKKSHNNYSILQATEISPDRGHTMEQGEQNSPVSKDGFQKSVDLQNNCLQLSTIVVSTAETDRIIKSSRCVRTRRLFPEEAVVNMEIPIVDDPEVDDPMGFDIMKEVSSIGKEASSQAMKDTGPFLSSPLKPCHAQQSLFHDDDASSGATNNASGKTTNVNTHSLWSSNGPLEPIRELEEFQQAHDSNPEPISLNGSSTSEFIDQPRTGLQPHQDSIVRQIDVSLADATPSIFASGSCPVAEIPNHQPVESSPPTATAAEGDPDGGDDSVYIPDSPGHDICRTAEDVQTVVSPICDGEFFDGAGSVNTAVKARAKRYGRSEGTIEGIAQLTKPSSKMKSAATRSYTQHVENSIFWGTERKGLNDPARNCGGQTKIRIRGVHVSEEEFVHTLKPNGQVDSNFMWLCSVAIMLGWQSKSRTIFNQTIIRELMKPHDTCDHEKIAGKLKLLPLDKIDQIYLPVSNNQHWILILITLSRGMVEIYDSLRTYKRGDDPYEDLWKTIGYNLQISFSFASAKPILVHDKFKRHYAQIQTQNNLNESGLEVTRLLVCHNGKDLIGYGKKNMASYRKEVAHILVYHRFNDLNPRRHAPIIEEDN